jgi:ribose-phosphate pyrophosphokinase
MNYSEPTRLAILACPGGARFADEVIVHLKRLYARRFDRKAAFLAKRYGMQKDDVVKQINFFNDVNSAQMGHSSVVERFRMPAFKIPARFTSFPNGELKTEILESIRGKDIYIFQDVENHQPVSFNDGKNMKVLSVNDHLMNLFVTVDAAK